MCDLGRHDTPHAFGFLVDAPEIRFLVNEAVRVTAAIESAPAGVEALRPVFATLLSTEGWLPDEYASPDVASGMAGGIGQYPHCRAEDR